jgi:hypothetical protein
LGGSGFRARLHNDLFRPVQPAAAKEGTWIQTMPGKGWFLLLRLYSPKESFFDKTWRPSEIELVR